MNAIAQWLVVHTFLLGIILAAVLTAWLFALSGVPLGFCAVLGVGAGFLTGRWAHPRVERFLNRAR